MVPSAKPTTKFISVGYTQNLNTAAFMLSWMDDAWTRKFFETSNNSPLKFELQVAVPNLFCSSLPVLPMHIILRRGTAGVREEGRLIHMRITLNIFSRSHDSM